MHVFLTGASGFVGSAVLQELLAGGHQVTGLVRSEAAAAAMASQGARARIGTLDDVDGLRHGAASADAVVHTAFDHDFSRYVASSALDRRAIEALGEGLAASGGLLLVTSGVAHLASGRAGTERDLAPPPTERFPRASEAAAADVSAAGGKVSVVRLPPSVHGEGDHGFVPLVIGLAREKGVSVHVGDGANRWGAVHRRDAARVYRLALERGEGGQRYHAVAEEGVPFRRIAEVIGDGLALPVEGRSGEAAAAHFGWFAGFAGLDLQASSAWTRERLGWAPAQPGLLEDMASAGYFAVPAR